MLAASNPSMLGSNAAREETDTFESVAPESEVWLWVHGCRLPNSKSPLSTVGVGLQTDTAVEELVEAVEVVEIVGVLYAEHVITVAVERNEIITAIAI
jgi:hypothetical protein